MADNRDYAFETTLGANTIPKLLREACQGLSRRLLEVCEAAAREAGAPRLYLETSSTLGPALALYDSFGFVRLPPRETPYVRADVFMEKALV